MRGQVQGHGQGRGRARTGQGQGEYSEGRARWGQGQGEGRIKETQSKDKGQGRARSGGGVSSNSGWWQQWGFCGAGSARCKIRFLGKSPDGGRLLHLIPIPDPWHLPTPLSIRLSRSSPSWPFPPSRSSDSDLCHTGWSVPVRLSALPSDQPWDSSTLPSSHPGPAASLRVALQLPSLLEGHPRPCWGPQLLTNTATPFLSSPCPFSLPTPFFLPATSLPRQ